VVIAQHPNASARSSRGEPPQQGIWWGITGSSDGAYVVIAQEAVMEPMWS
jgi:hypothetical protein